jgi:hypothetical protein
MKEIINCYAQFHKTKLNEAECIDFLSGIRTQSKSDMDILKTWQEYFESVGTPYIVEQCGNILKLLKEKKVNG